MVFKGHKCSEVGQVALDRKQIWLDVSVPDIMNETGVKKPGLLQRLGLHAHTCPHWG